MPVSRFSPPRYAPWDVVRVAFPYADQADVRRRPALIIAAPRGPARFAVVWLLMITSARRERWPDDVEVEGWRSAGLTHPCVVRASKVASIDTRLAEPIGRLDAPDRRAVALALADFLRDTLAA